MQRFPLKNGVFTSQAHVRVPEGTYEMEYGREGFFGEATHLYTREMPSAWKRIEGQLKPMALDCRLIVTEDSLEPRGTPALLMQSMVACARKSLSIFLTRRREPMPYLYRTVDGDELYFVHRGEGYFETEFGLLPYQPGDYIIMPKGCIYRLVPQTDDLLAVLAESRTAYGIPDRGILGLQALFDPGVIQYPDFDRKRSDLNSREIELQIKRAGFRTRLYFDYNPIDNVVGYKGTVVPSKLNVRDFRPVASMRYHVPPTAGATFASREVFVGTFAPRFLGDDETLRLPYYHRNIDYDEVIFYHEGTFFSRGGIEPGMLTLHPMGIDHGPHPQAWERDRQGLTKETKEYAVALDAVEPLMITAEGLNGAIEAYSTSWYSPSEGHDGNGAPELRHQRNAE
jgi:homogentisate 1,2-dioxygenase